MSIVFDFDEIARRVGRKPDAEALNLNVQQHDQDAAKLAPSAVAAIRTLKSLGYTYEHGAQLWKPPLVPQRPIQQAMQNAFEAFSQSSQCYQSQGQRALSDGGIGGVILENADMLNNIINQQQALGQQQQPSMRERLEAIIEAEQLANQSSGRAD